MLRAARLRRRISLAEAEQATRIRQRYLEALEDDDYSVVPPGGYSWGFLRNYAIYLGVPPEEVMGDYRTRRRRDRRTGLRTVASPIRITAPRSVWFLAFGGAVVLVLGLLIWLGVTAPDNPAETGANAPAASPTTRLTLPPLAPAATPSAMPTAQPTAGATPTNPAASRQVEVELRTTARAWVRATVDGRLAFEETLPAGQVHRWTGQQTVALRVGNGAGVDVTVNGQRVGALGPAGQPVDREFTLPR